MLKFAVVWPTGAEPSAANLLCIPYSQYNPTIHDFYTIVEVPNPDDSE